MPTQEKDKLPQDILVSELIEAYELRDLLRAFRDPEESRQSSSWDSNAADLAHIEGLVRRLRLIKAKGTQALENDEAPRWLRQIQHLQIDKRHIELFSAYAPDMAAALEAKRQNTCRTIGGHLTWLALG